MIEIIDNIQYMPETTEGMSFEKFANKVTANSINRIKDSIMKIDDLGYNATLTLTGDIANYQFSVDCENKDLREKIKIAIQEANKQGNP